MKGITKQPPSGISYAGKVVLVTGAASGIGRAMALAFGRAGACVVIADTAVDGGHMTAALIVEAGGKALFVKTNVTVATEVDALIDKAVAHYGRVDVAVREELARAVKDGFTNAELAGAKSGLMQQRIQTRAEDGALAAGWTSYLYRGRTFEWSAEFERRLMAVTLPQLNAAFRKALDPSKLSVVMAGDQSKAGAKH